MPWSVFCVFFRIKGPTPKFQDIFQVSISHVLDVWYIYLQLGDIFLSNVGKYSMHGAYGYVSI